MGRRSKIVLGVVVLVVLLGAGGWWWIRRDTSRPVSMDEARRRLSTTTTLPGTAPPSVVAGAPERPAAGVYEYTGTGTEELSLPPLSQDQGPTIPATVEHRADGCWSIRFDYSTNHWQTWTYCTQGPDLVEVGGESWQRWMVGATAITNLTTATCDDVAVLPADRTAGQTWPARCVATNEAVSGDAVSAGPYRFVGDEDLDVDGETVATAHFVREREMSGAQVGSERSEVWFALDSGLPVRNERRIEVDTDTPVGSSTYREEGSFSLVSVQPTS